MGADSITVQDLNDLGERIRSKREWIGKIKDELKQHQGLLKILESEFIACLRDLNMKKYAIPGYGTAYIRDKFSYKVPQSPDAKDAFFQYLKIQGIFESMATVHSTTLNAWANEEFKKAQEAGASDFQIPGLGDPTHYETLGVKK